MPFDHVGLRVTDINKSREFYLAALKPLGYKLKISILDGQVIGLGGSFGPDFWLASIDTSTTSSESQKKPTSEDEILLPKKDFTVDKVVHIAFKASNRQQVREFYEAATSAGGKSNGPPGLRPEYHATYYGAYVLDPQGRNIEAVCHKPRFFAEPWGFVGWSTIGVIGGALSGALGKFMGWL